MFTGPNIITDGLVFALDAANTKSYTGTGTVWNDLSGNGNSGTLVNGPTFDSGDNGSIVFDGVDDRLDVINPNVEFNSQLTLEAWIKVEHTGDYGGLFRQNGLGNFGLSIRGNDGFVVHYIGNNSGVVNGWWVISGFSGLLAGPSNWHHICSTTDMSISGATNRWFYIDSVERASRTQEYTSQQVPFTNNDLIMVANNFSGKVGIQRIYNRALTPEEIQQNYNATKSRYGL